MATLYRKYRPGVWSDVVDQDHVAQTLQNEIIASTLAHAYLFSGPRGVGKTTSARLFAKAVNCADRAKKSAEPCNVCSSCIDINAGRHIDVIEIDAASQTGVDNVRENIIDNAQFKPTTAKYKVFIIDEVHMLSTSAFNALLKTLEEPPAYVVFILATTELHKLPATVISRCQRFAFKKIGYEPMLGRLQKIAKEEKITVETAVFDRVIGKSDGCLRDAESLLGQIFSLNLKKVTLNDVALILPSVNHEIVLACIEHLVANEVTEAINVLHNEMNNGLAPDHFAFSLLELLRALLVIQMSRSTLLYRTDYSERMLTAMQELTKKIPTEQLITLIELTLKRRIDIKTSPIQQLPLELLIAETALALHRPAPAAPIQQSVAVHQPTQQRAPTITAPTPAPLSKTEIASPTATPATPTDPTPTRTRTPGTAVVTTLDTIQNRWNELVAKVDENNHSLTFILKMCSLKTINHDHLILGTQYSFHKEKIEESKNKKAVEQVMEALFGERIFIACEIDQAPTAEATNELQTLAVAFGGEIVN